MNGFAFHTVPSIVFGSGASARTGEIAGRFGRRAALVTDAGVVRAGLVEPAVASLREAGIAVAVHDGVVADPPETVVIAAVEGARAHGADMVVGLGGGSSLDAVSYTHLTLPTN